jgi:glycosyltransferase involved in cell wall biosynthesis
MPVIAVLLHDLSLGGTERVAIRLANAWNRLGCRVLLYVGDDRGIQRELVAPGVQIHVATPRIPRGLGSRWWLSRWFARRCEQDRIDVAFLPGNFYFFTIGFIVSATGGAVPVFAKISNSLWRGDRSALRNRLFALLTRARLRRARAAIAMSPSLEREAGRVLGHPVNVIAIPDPVLDSLPTIDESLRRSGHLCAIGRLVRQKNFALLLRAFACLRDLPVTLDIVGDGEQRSRLEELAVSLGIADRVRFTGAVGDVQPYLAQAEVLMLTSDFEGLPAVIIEALAAATFVVARDCSPAIRELLGSPTVGAVVAGNDPQKLAQAVREHFATRERDPQRMRAIAAAHLVDTVAGRYLATFGAAGS